MESESKTEPQCHRSGLLFSGDNDTSIKDDTLTSQKILFGILAVMTLMVSILCTSNGILLNKNKRFQNLALLFFYIFAVLTLLCKKTLVKLIILVRLLYLLDIVINWSGCTYQLFKWLPSYTYATTAYCYITNWYGFSIDLFLVHNCF